ncbi:MAG TPA: serine/threonine-protein kinase [Gemmataceae bacterium]|nr:serine/threonine-protein kinase [Gemmataceae bacterium]
MTDQPRQDVQSQEQERMLERTLSSPAPRLATESISTAKAPTFRAPAEPAPANRGLVFPGVGQRIDDFEIERVLGEGAFGKVYLARQVSLERHVALKVTANWGNEARTLASLEHDYIVHVFSETVDPAHDLRLMCMQFVPGTTLQRIIQHLETQPRDQLDGKSILAALDSLSTLPAAFHPAALRDRELLADADFNEAVCLFGARLAEALDYAHRQGVLHRDIKPANILVTPYGRPMLTDFNLSLNTERAPDRERDTCGGTLAYMAPEHLDAFNPDDETSAAAVDQRSDVYSLGVVLYELLTLRRPFRQGPTRPGTTDSLRAMADLRRLCAPSPAADYPEAPELLVAVIRRCLDPDPARRYQTGGELARALEGCSEMQRIRRELPHPRLSRFALWRPFLFLAIFIFLPHFLGSLVNITYNKMQIVSRWSPEQERRFETFVLWYNLLVYPPFLAAALFILLPPFRVWRALTRCEPCDNAVVNTVRRRTLAVPGWVVALSCLGWLPGGVVFPLAIHLMDPATSPVDAGVWIHFLTSFTISGLIALTYSYFATQIVVLRVLYPRFWVNPSGLREKSAEELGQPRLWLFQLLAGVIPLAGAVLLVAVGPETSGDRLFRVLAMALILLGMAGFGLAVLANNFLAQTIAVLTRRGVAARYRPLPGENTSWKK